MGDAFEVVKNASGFGERFGNSIKGVLFGVVLFLVSFPLIWWGETRQNLAEFVKEATKIESNAAVSVPAETLVKTSGPITSSQTALDPQFLGSTPKQALLLKRRAEMYAWKEKKKTKTKGEKKITTYEYVKTWTSSPQDSSNFHQPNGHQNPAFSIQSSQFKVNQVKVGQLEVDAASATFWKLADLSLKKEHVNLSYAKPLQVSGGNIYISHYQDPKASQPRQVANSPIVGDVRVSYSFFPKDVQGTVVGSWDGNKIAAHYYDGDDSFLGVYAGSPKAFESYLNTRHSTMTWILRGLSFIAMWLGLNLILGPLTTLMGAVPILGNMGKAMVSLVTGFITLVLWGATIFLANFWLVLLFIIALGVGGFFVYKKQTQSQEVTYSAS